MVPTPQAPKKRDVLSQWLQNELTFLKYFFIKLLINFLNYLKQVNHLYTDVLIDVDNIPTELTNEGLLSNDDESDINKSTPYNDEKSDINMATKYNNEESDINKATQYNDAESDINKAT